MFIGAIRNFSGFFPVLIQLFFRLLLSTLFTGTFENIIFFQSLHDSSKGKSIKVNQFFIWILQKNKKIKKEKHFSPLNILFQFSNHFNCCFFRMFMLLLVENLCTNFHMRQKLENIKIISENCNKIFIGFSKLKFVEEFVCWSF